MLIGHDEPAAAFRAAFDEGRMHHAWLLAGQRGIGKATFAHAAATWLLARAAGPREGIGEGLAVDPGHPVAALVAARSHLDLRVLERVANPNGNLRAEIALDQLVRRTSSPHEPLRSIFQSTPALSDWRVVIIDAIDEMNRNAANALLKYLEEPPAGTVFLCVCHAPGRLLPTLRSRCRRLNFGLLADAGVARVLDAEAPGLAPADRNALVAIAGGVPGRALRFADAGVSRLPDELRALADGGDTSGRALALAKSLAGKGAAGRYAAFLELAPAAIAAAARGRTGSDLARTLAAWEQASALAASAAGGQLDPQSVAFELAGLVAGLSG